MVGRVGGRVTGRWSDGSVVGRVGACVCRCVMRQDRHGSPTDPPLPPPPPSPAESRPGGAQRDVRVLSAPSFRASPDDVNIENVADGTRGPLLGGRFGENQIETVGPRGQGVVDLQQAGCSRAEVRVRGTAGSQRLVEEQAALGDAADIDDRRVRRLEVDPEQGRLQGMADGLVLLARPVGLGRRFQRAQEAFLRGRSRC